MYAGGQDVQIDIYTDILSQSDTDTYCDPQKYASIRRHKGRHTL